MGGQRVAPGGGRVKDAPRDGPREAQRGGMTQQKRGLAGRIERAGAGGGGEHEVAIHRRVTGRDRACHAVMRGSGHAGGLGLGQRGIGCDDGDGRRLARVALEAGHGGGVVDGRGAEAAELGPDLTGRGEEMRAVAASSAARPRRL